MINYILHVSLLLGLGFILYQLLLKKETFYSLNRIILVSYLGLAFALPLIHIPSEWSLRQENSIYAMGKIGTDIKSDLYGDSLDNDLEKVVPNQVNGDSQEPKYSDKENLTNEDLIKSEKGHEILKKTENEAVTNVKPEKLKSPVLLNLDWLNIIKWIYIIGLGIFLINFLVQFSILIFYRLKYPTLKDGKMTIVEMPEGKAPFSFLNMIYINPTKYDYDTYEQILAHEKIHITKWHSADIFLSELALIVLWFNPFAWLYRKAVEHNLEYLTDQEMLASGANAEVYQMNLLKVSVPDLPLALSTNYNQSFLKKRIQMMNSKKSSARSTWKYLFILPILGFSMAIMNPTLSVAQSTTEEKTEQIKDQNTAQKTESSTDQQSESSPALTTTNQIITSEGITVKTTTQSPVAINNKIELIDQETIEPKKGGLLNSMADLGLKGEKDLFASGDDDKLIVTSGSGKSITLINDSGRTIIRSNDEDIETKGIWEAEIMQDKVCFYIKKGGIGKNYFWSSTDCIQATDFSPAIKRNSEGEFTLTREAGTLVLRGEFDGNNGTGRYTFTPDPTFKTFASTQGYNIEEKKLIHFFLSDFDKDFFSFLKKNGYINLDDDKLLAMAIHDVNEDYIQDINGEFRKINYEDLTVDELIAFKIHDVDMEYIKSFGKELYEDLTPDQIVSSAIHDVDPSFISQFKGLGFDDLSFDNLISAAIHDLNIDYIKEFKAAGFNDLDFDDLISASIHDVDPEYIKAFEAAGIQNIKFDDLVSASIHDVDVDFIKEFETAGFDDLDFDDLISAAIHDVDIDYLKKARGYGFNLSFDQLVSASIHDVDLEYLKTFKEAGFKNVDFDDMISASIHDVDPSYIREFTALGFKDLSFDNLISAAIHNVEPSLIKEIRAAGLENISFDDVISFGIHDIDVEDIKGLKDMGFNLDADDLISAGIHGVSPRFIKKMQAKGYKDLSFNEYVKLKIHGF